MKKNLHFLLLTILVTFTGKISMAVETNAGCSDAGVASASSDSICDNGHTDLILAAYVGAIQWQSYNGTLWVDETGTGSTTDFYTVTLTASTEFRAVVTMTGCDPDTSNTVLIIVGVTAPTGNGDTRCGYGQVNLTATGTGPIKWYDAATNGNLLYTGSPFTPNVAATTTFYAANTSNGGGSATTVMPPEATTFFSNVRGYWFTAPSDFTITGLFVPNPANGTTQNIAVIRFVPPVPPPFYATTTNAFNTLFLTQNDPSAGVIPVNIPILTGDVIGVLASRGTNDANSYAPSPSTTTIAGQTVTISRMGMQYPLATTAPQDVWQEAGGSISRLEITYEVGCESSRIPIVATVTPSAPVTIGASPPALCMGESSILTANSTNPSYTYTWSPATGLSSTTGTPVTATPTSPITYTVVAVDGSCGAIDSFFLDVGMPSVAGTAVLSIDTICQGTYSYLQLTGSLGNIQWQGNSGLGWFDETGTGNDSSLYPVSPAVSTDYWAIVTSGGCDPDTTIMLHVEVIAVVDPLTVSDTICGAGTVNLTASGPGTLNWYTAQSGGTLVNSGNTYSPSLSTTTTYYVRSLAGGLFNMGPGNYNIGTQSNNLSTDFGLGFDVNQQIILNKVYIYPAATGNITINLRDIQGGPVLNTVTVPVIGFSGPTPINLGWTLNPGTGYRLELDSGSVSLYYNTTGATYPYVTPGGLLTITGFLDPNFNTGLVYYYFYNWEISDGCQSNPIPVTGYVGGQVPTITQMWNTLTSSAPTGNQWYLNGNLIPGATSQDYTMSVPGTYTVVVTDQYGCTATSPPYVVNTIGIEELENPGITIYPNPVSENLYINFSPVFSAVQSLRITNTTGETVYEKKDFTNPTHFEINFKHFAKGTYILEINMNNLNYKKPFLKQ